MNGFVAEPSLMHVRARRGRGRSAFGCPLIAPELGPVPQRLKSPRNPVLVVLGYRPTPPPYRFPRKALPPSRRQHVVQPAQPVE